MIATHTPKIFNARLKQAAIASYVSSPAPHNSICSQTVTMRRELWAAPNNAADIKEWRETVAALPAGYLVTPSLPDITDPQLKQLLVPLDWRNDNYLSVTPVASMGVGYELYNRLYEMNLPYRKWVIQPNPMAMANHGESMMLQSGTVRMMRRGPRPMAPSEWQGDFVQLTANCQHMNISSGMLALGYPAITALGGMVHAMERKLGADIEFAFGMKSSDWISGVPKLTVDKGNRSSSVGGRVAGGKITPVTGFDTEAVTANAEVVLLLRTEGSLDELAGIVQNIHRLAGGSLFDVSVSVVRGGQPEAASYLIDASADIAQRIKAGASDNLQAALELYGEHGEWRDGEWHQPPNDYILNHTGYAPLEAPVSRSNARGNYPHVWSEPLFSLLTQGTMSEAVWWIKERSGKCVFWKAKSPAS